MAFIYNQLKIKTNSECLFILFISPNFIHLFAYGKKHMHMCMHMRTHRCVSHYKTTDKMTVTEFRAKQFAKFQGCFVPNWKCPSSTSSNVIKSFISIFLKFWLELKSLKMKHLVQTFLTGFFSKAESESSCGKIQFCSAVPLENNCAVKLPARSSNDGHHREWEEEREWISLQAHRKGRENWAYPFPLFQQSSFLLPLKRKTHMHIHLLLGYQTDNILKGLWFTAAIIGLPAFTHNYCVHISPGLRNPHLPI